MRKFEKISKEQYEKDLKELCSYEDISIPTRSTKHSAGYDFKSPIEFTLNPGESKKVPTGIKASMNEDEFLAILVRSSMGFKYNMRLCNQVGIVDSDYYNNPDNEGDIIIALETVRPDTDCCFKQGDAIAQGIIVPFYKVEDDNAEGDRVGGFGSTGN